MLKFFKKRLKRTVHETLSYSQHLQQQNFLEDLGLNTLPKEKQTELLITMTESILKRITIRVLEHLSKKEKKEFDEVRETSDPDKISEFLAEKIDNYDQMVQEVISEFKEEMITTMQGLQADLAE